jgi:hypothetical protein
MNRSKMHEKKQNNFKTPDISKMQEVIINARTRIYINMDADPEEARMKYLARQEAKGKVVIVSRKPVAS